MVDGYHIVYPYVRGTGRTRMLKVHTAVLTTFVGPKPPGMEARHLDGNKANNVLNNLAWGTRVENCDDKRRHGTLATGERMSNAKLTVESVREIRSLAATQSLRSLAREYGVSHTTIRRAITEWPSA